jgi:hypothetical protein
MHVALCYSVILATAITARKMKKPELAPHNKSIPITEKEDHSHLMRASEGSSDARIFMPYQIIREESG